MEVYALSAIAVAVKSLNLAGTVDVGESGPSKKALLFGFVLENGREIRNADTVWVLFL